MSNIAKAFENGKAFIPFITCGDPDLETTAQCVVEMQKAGASLIELGIPFSDPTAEGPVIMEASLRALEGGCTTDKVFGMVKRLRNELVIENKEETQMKKFQRVRNRRNYPSGRSF